MNETIDVETVPSGNPNTALTVRPQMAVAQPMGVKEIIAQVKLIQDVMREVMTEGEHFGTIPGCGDKKTLLQPGAQKLTMTFRLAPEYQIQETDLERGHKEYRVVCTLKSIQTGNFVGQGVGCCSSMESKYRYRGGARKCPKCGKEAIIMGKRFKPTDPEPGWLCWKKKEGCGATWPVGAPEIESQSIEKVENENPADTFNTVLKIAKKRAFVDATITATAASDIFTQDIGDDENPENLPNGSSGDNPKGKTSTVAPGRVGTSHPASSHPPKPQAGGPPAKPAAAPPPNKPTAPEKRYATAASRAWLIKRLEPCRDLATEYFRKLNNPEVLLPNENLEDLGLQFIPLTLKQAKALDEAITNFGNGAEAQHAFPPNELKPGEKWKEPALPKTPPAALPPPPPPPTRTPAQAPAPPNKRDPDWFWGIICPVPPKGVKKADYIKAPDTIRSLYTRMKKGDSEVAGKRLWGFVNHYEPKPWTGNDGQVRQPSNADLVFREALDAFLEWHEKHGEDTQSQPEPETSGHDYSPQPGEDESVPF